jgi:hypothetical protein
MEFPDLRIVRREDVLLHEETDAGRQIRLIERMTADGVLRNPPVVGSLNDSSRYLLLDGANRVAALDYMNVPHLLVQVEDFDNPSLVLSHWNHVVRDEEAKTILEMIQAIPGVSVSSGPAGDWSCEQDRRYLCSIVFKEDRHIQVFGGNNVVERVRLLRWISSLYYHGVGRIDRVTHTELEVIQKHHKDFGALLAYRDFCKDEIREAAETGHRLPSGLTRFLMPRRVLCFNADLEMLKSGESLEEKQHGLEADIQRKVQEKKVRHYEEPTYIFDD